jgi:hypothetical protein
MGGADGHSLWIAVGSFNTLVKKVNPYRSGLAVVVLMLFL